MNLGKRLCSYRKRTGMSQQELAEYLNVSRQSISKWETDVAMPTIENLQRLGELYGVSIDELINSSNDTMKNDAECIENKHITTIVKQKNVAWLCVAFSCIILTVFLLIATYFSNFGLLSRKTGNKEVWVQSSNTTNGTEGKFFDISDLQKSDTSGPINVIGLE